MRSLLTLAVLAAALPGQEPLALEQAEDLAVRQHPRLRSAQHLTDASRAQVVQARGANQPFLAGNFTSSAADHGSRIGAGGLNASSIFSRVGTGVAINQNLWDFGRAAKLVESASSRVESQAAAVDATRAQIRWEARQAYLRALGLERSLAVAKAALDARQLSKRQIQALVDNQLRSTLDLQFAEVALGDAEVTVARLEGELKAAQAVLSTALGFAEAKQFVLADPPAAADAAPDVEELVREALASRPEVASRRHQTTSARLFAESERRLVYPTVTATGVFGFVPAGDPRLRTRYGGLGLNLNIPVFNGRTFQARRQEADSRANSAAEDVKDAELRVAREVRSAHAEALNAQRRIGLAERYLAQASRLLTMAETRYNAGLGNIVEVNQAEVAKMTAELNATNARYEYRLALGWLDFTLGRLR